MVDKTHTTETLRGTLFATIDGVLEGSIDPATASSVAKLADQVIKTADLEMKYTQHLAKLDVSEADVAPGPMLLAAAHKKPQH